MKSELSSVHSKHIPIGKERCSILDNFKKKGWGLPLNPDTRARDVRPNSVLLGALLTPTPAQARHCVSQGLRLKSGEAHNECNRRP
jgi:hypothetical protein